MLLPTLCMTMLASPVTALSIPCEEIDLITSGGSEYEDECFRVEFPFYFDYDRLLDPPSFDVNEIVVRFTLIGNRVFDYDATTSNVTGLYVNMDSSSSTQFIIWRVSDEEEQIPHTIRSSNSPNLDEITVDFKINNPLNLSIEVSSEFCGTNSCRLQVEDNQWIIA